MVLHFNLSDSVLLVRCFFLQQEPKLQTILQPLRVDPIVSKSPNGAVLQAFETVRDIDHDNLQLFNLGNERPGSGDQPDLFRIIPLPLLPTLWRVAYVHSVSPYGCIHFALKSGIVQNGFVEICNDSQGLLVWTDRATLAAFRLLCGLFNFSSMRC